MREATRKVIFSPAIKYLHTQFVHRVYPKQESVGERLDEQPTQDVSYIDYAKIRRVSFLISAARITQKLKGCQ